MPADPCLFEPLEPRQLLAGVTVVTHGFYLFGGSPMGWVDSMADGVADRADAALGSSTRFDLVLNEDFSVGHTAPKRSLPSTNSSAEIVIGFDWTAHSGDTTSTPRIAQALAATLLNTSYWGFLGLTGTIAELPIHFVGHSRGGSLVGELARLLGTSGVWVDHVTTLDPHPAREIGYSDPDAVLYTNTIFGDNYRQTNSYPTGASVAGAFEDNLTGASPTVGHSDVHAFYHGTVKTGAGSDGDGTTIYASWYSSDPWPGVRADTGFRWSLIGGGDRMDEVPGVSSPRDGLWSGIGGQGGRSAFSPGELTGAVWSNVTGVTLDTGSALEAGRSVTSRLWYMDHDSDVYVQFYLDSDRNPYNSSPVYGVGSGQTLAKSDLESWASTWTVPHVSGTFFLMAVIADGVHTRYAHLPGAVTITEPLPDLAVSRILAPRGTYLIGQRVSLGATVVNRGLGEAGTFTVSFYLATEGGTLVRSIDDDGRDLGLAPGTSYAETLGDRPDPGWVIPGDLSPGRYRIMILADASGTVTETDEANNWTATGVFTIAGGSGPTFGDDRGLGQAGGDSFARRRPRHGSPEDDDPSRGPSIEDLNSARFLRPQREPAARLYGSAVDDPNLGSWSWPASTSVRGL